MKKKFVMLALSYRCDKGVHTRDIVVPVGFSLAFLHSAIQVALGWLDYHLYAFRTDKACYTIPDPDIGLAKGEKLATRTPIAQLFPKAGAKCLYEYDFGDGNEVEIVCKGLTAKFAEEDFMSEGVDLVEDSAAFGFTPGIVELLTKKRRSASAKHCIAWLGEAFDLTPEDVLCVPTAKEIYIRVARIVDFVYNSIPKPY